MSCPIARAALDSLSATDGLKLEEMKKLCSAKNFIRIGSDI